MREKRFRLSAPKIQPLTRGSRIGFTRRLATAALVIVNSLCGVRAEDYDLGDPSEPWASANAGITTEVPAPFEPLRVEGPRVSLWGRSYLLGGLLPEQITNQGVATFHRAPSVIVGLEAGRRVAAPSAPVVTLARPDRVEVAGSTRAGDVHLKSTAWLEYDGVMRVDLTLSPAKPTTLEYFSVEFSFRPSVALFCHHHTVRGGHENVSVPEEIGQTLRSRWNALWWLGDHDRGLTLFTENNFDWSDSESAVEIGRRESAVVLRFNIWSTPRTLARPVTFSLGLHATPSKPLPARWQARYVTFGGVGEHLPGSYGTIWHQNQKFYSYPEPADPPTYRELIRTMHEGRLRVCPYFTPAGTSPDAPVVKRHYDDWLRTKPNGEPLWIAGSVDSGASRNVSLCTASTYTDFMTWGMTKFLEAYDVDGVYFDNAFPYPCANTRHGCGREGRASYPIFANREYFKRMYELTRQHNADSGDLHRRLIWQHNSRYMVSPALSFVDVYSDGEQFRFDRHSQPLTDIDATFRSISFTGAQWGAQPCFLPAMSSAKPWLTQWGMAATMPYGNILIPSPGWTDFTAQRGLLRTRRSFVESHPAVRFYRPHELPVWLQVGVETEVKGKRTKEPTLAGAYVNAIERRVLLVISNLSARPGTLRINTALLRQHLGGDIEVVDALTDAPSLRANSDPILRLSIAAGTCRMFRIAAMADEE